MHEETVGGFGKMITYGHTLVISTHHNIQQIALAFLKAHINTLEFLALDEMKRKLVVMVAQHGVFSIERNPRGVLFYNIATGQVHIGCPYSGTVARHTHSLLHEMVVYIKSQVTMGNLATLEVDDITHLPVSFLKGEDVSAVR